MLYQAGRTYQRMSQNEGSSLLGKRVLHWVVFLLLGTTTLVVVINANDSSIAKTPLLVIFSGLLASVFTARGIRDGRLKLYQSPVDIPVLLLLLLMIVSAFYSEYRWSSQQALIVWGSFFICFFAGSQLFRSPREIDHLVRVMAWITGAACVVGLVQFFFSDALPVEFFLGKERRVGSTLTNPVYFSGYIVLLFPVLLTFTISKGRTQRERWVLGGLLSSMVFLLLATSTRSSVVAFLFSMFFLGFLLLTRTRLNMKPVLLGALGIAAVLVASLCLSPSLLERAERASTLDSSSSLARRWYFWDAGYHAFADSPYLGHGIGSYEQVMLEFRSPDYWAAKSEDIVPHAHNEFIETAVDLGGVGLILYVTIMAIVLWKAMRTSSNEKAQLMILGLACALLGILIDNMANMSLRVVPVGATAWLITGILAGESPGFHKTSEVAVRLPRSLWLLPIACWTVFAVWYGSTLVDNYEAEGHIVRGMFAREARALGESIREFDLAVAKSPHSLLARSSLTLSLLLGGHPAEALASAKQLKNISPRYPKVNLMEAIAQVSLQRYPEALKSINEELSLRNHPDAYYYRVLAYAGMGDTTNALSSLDSLLEVCMREKVTYQLRSASAQLRLLARTAETRTHFKRTYERLTSVFPHDPDVSMTLAALSESH